MRSAVSAGATAVVSKRDEGELRNVSRRASAGFARREFVLVVLRSSVNARICSSLLMVRLTLRNVALRVNALRRAILVNVTGTVVVNDVFSAALGEGVVVLRRDEVRRCVLPIVVLFEDRVRHRVRQLRAEHDSELYNCHDPVEYVRGVRMFNEDVGSSVNYCICN